MTGKKLILQHGVQGTDMKDNILDITPRIKDKREFEASFKTTPPPDLQYLLDFIEPGNVVYFCDDCHSATFGIMKKEGIQICLCLSCGKPHEKIMGFTFDNK